MPTASDAERAAPGRSAATAPFIARADPSRRGAQQLVEVALQPRRIGRRPARASSSRRADRRRRDGPRARWPAAGASQPASAARSARRTVAGANAGRAASGRRGAIACSVSARGGCVVVDQPDLVDPVAARRRAPRAAGAAARAGARSARRRRRRRRRRAATGRAATPAATARAVEVGQRQRRRHRPRRHDQLAVVACAPAAGRRSRRSTRRSPAPRRRAARRASASGRARSRRSAAAPRGDGSEWTLKLTSSAGSAASAPGRTIRIPDIEAGDDARRARTTGRRSRSASARRRRRRPVARAARRPRGAAASRCTTESGSRASPVSRAKEARSRFCRIGPLAAPANSNSRAGARATLPSTRRPARAA